MRRDVYALLCQFQFTPLHERQRCSFRNAYQLYYFNSRLYMRGNLCVERTRTYRAISIHASTREATHFKGITGYPTLFQFTPLYERQHCTSVRAMPVSLFQFTPLHERQRQLVYPHQVEKGNFNSRLCMRGNPVSADIIHAAGVFQFTPLHERQQKQATGTETDGHFNSRLCMRGNADIWYINQRLYISIHASA